MKSHYTFFAAVLIIFVIILLPSFAPRSKAPESHAETTTLQTQSIPVEESEPENVDTELEVFEYQAQVDAIDYILAAAAEVAEGIPDAERVVRAFTNNAMYTTVAPGDMIISIKSQRVPMVPVYVIMIFPEQIVNMAVPPRNTISYEDGRLFFLYEGNWARWTTGLIALHEMSHWHDIEYTAIEPKDISMTSDAFILGEFRAYLLEIAALNKLTNDAWQDAVELVVEDARYSFDNGTPYRQLTNDGVAYLFQTLPSQQLTPQEWALLEGLAVVHTTLVQCELVEEQIAAYRAIFLPHH